MNAKQREKIRARSRLLSSEMVKVDPFVALSSRRTLRPVVPPGDDQVAVLRAVSVLEEVAAQELEFNGHALTASGLDFAQGLAIGEGALRAQHGEPQALRQNAKEQDHAVFVRGLVRQSGASKYRSVDGASAVKLQFLAARELDRRRGRRLAGFWTATVPAIPGK